jgi:hypothetical protein
MEGTIQREKRAVIQPVGSDLNETAVCKKATETEPDPRMMQSIEAAVMPVVGTRKRDRVCSMGGERRQKWKIGPGTILDPGGSRLSSAGWCPTVQNWHSNKRNLLRDIQTQRNCGSRKRLTVPGRKTTCRAIVAWRIENVLRKGWSRNQAKRKTTKR